MESIKLTNDNKIKYLANFALESIKYPRTISNYTVNYSDLTLGLKQGFISNNDLINARVNGIKIKAECGLRYLAMNGIVNHQLISTGLKNKLILLTRYMFI